MKELDGLLLFAVVCKHMSFVNASRELNVPNTTLSRKIKALETHVGGKLLERTTRSLRLTDLGQKVYIKATKILETIDELKKEVDDASNIPAGELKISCPRAIAQTLLLPLFTDFKRAFSKITLRINTSPRYLNFIDHKLDFAFRFGHIPDSNLISMALTEISYILVSSPNYATNINVSHPSQLSQFDKIIYLNEDKVQEWELSHNKEILKLNMDGQIYSDDFNLTLSLVLMGRGIAYLPCTFVRKHLISGELIQILPDWKSTKLPLRLLYSEKSNLSKKSKSFIDFVREQKSKLNNYL
ncbi:LysR family transcriptional regulator [Paraphotobacterium marinum]|uniref:LysR family transcriptional regulator n=1 Tax=Paraphotobacterium marinum TaxID=1755811 RepID=A0A220VEV3_9GAMM|nr:LysR family transcriptional regulator [Paraphotobacterium marinum]ASK78948.1 LysR family transcriptional regulator [Paraphotobacterium marinum]